MPLRPVWDKGAFFSAKALIFEVKTCRKKSKSPLNPRLTCCKISGRRDRHLCSHLREKVLKNAKDAKLAWIEAAFEERTEIREPDFIASES